MTKEEAEQELSRNTIKIEEIINCDVDDEIKLKLIKMRDITPEEREIINKYIKSISKPTGINLWSLYKDPREDAISRQIGHWINNQNGTFECDQCGCKHSKSRFCPNCGTKMVKPQKRSDNFEFVLHSPLTKEDWNKISNAEHEHTESVTFQTPQGKQVRYIKCDVLDKIRAEIIENAKRTMNDTRAEGLYMALNIVDKYKAESEE